MSVVAPYPGRFARLVKIEHTIFALPFAYVGAFLAVGGAPSAHDLFWITLAMVGARSLAMALNRLVDVGIDARNPRTAGRELPSGQLSVLQVGFRVRDLLTQRGANVVMTRTTPDPVDLGLRAIISRRANAHAFVSIHLSGRPVVDDVWLYRV